jgi:maltose alpha-D-glucosyltransferase/alpha-amylase
MRHHLGGELWYKRAVIYAVDVGLYQDGDGDGIGDFKGLTGRLDHLASLGVTCLWLLPFYPTPNRDNGYDVVDHFGVEPRVGTPGDFAEFMRQATARGIRVLIDLVVHHTSDEHPWFRAARSDPDSPYHNYYVWGDDPSDRQTMNVFPGAVKRPWTRVDEVGQYYRHIFYPFEPDLDILNPEVREQIRLIMGYWLGVGAAGFRVDAASHLVGRQPLEGGDAEPHRLMREFHDFVAARHGDAVLLGETDVSPDELVTYFGDGDELNMLFNFLLDNYLFLAFARQEAEPIDRALRLLPDKPAVGQWANFLRNLDELDLERLSDDERQEVYAEFAPDPDMRIYRRGIRRRLAPMLGNDRRRLELAYSLLFTLPGTPVIPYGDEIGMGDDLSRPERGSVRAPMQWSDEPNGGFSSVPSDQLVQPMIEDGTFGYERVNVRQQWRDPGSLLSWMQRALAVRRQCPEFGRGSCEALVADNPAVFVHCLEWEGDVLVVAHNLADQPHEAELTLAREDGARLVDLFGDRLYDPLPAGSRQVTLSPFGYRWFRLYRA